MKISETQKKGDNMDKSIGYLRESLSNYLEDSDVCRSLFKRINTEKFDSEEDFVKTLTVKEIEVLNEVIKEEIDYANQEQDLKRANELNEVYELLF